MPEPKHFIMVPNSEHSMATGIFMITPAIAAWCNRLLSNKPMPKFDWNIDHNSGEIVATMLDDEPVHEAKVWWATSCGRGADGIDRRDFRVLTLDPQLPEDATKCHCGVWSNGMCTNVKSFWQHKTLEAITVNGKRTYSANVAPPADGTWVAFLIDISYKNTRHDKEENHLPGFVPKDLNHKLEFTTEVSIMPNTFPYPGCGVDTSNGPPVPCLNTMV